MPGPMPVISSLRWICRQLVMGLKDFVAYCEARDTGKFNVKVTFEPTTAGTIDRAVADGLVASLTLVHVLLVRRRATDHGHEHSDIASEIFSGLIGRGRPSSLIAKLRLSLVTCLAPQI
eukprot:gnl/TRDRNA2_/TRDRNA2_59374_c0_seq1.p1 gnl/TRDRNA2_/TRDRNA2_59374_c0~~gnl/TRDRNA2_/TRDRNA2_59374_c0_seq1.p1  ORF type:complete len:119 (+),score=12.15 gnl/TRDRNA2_/TRDRNA2_59374_c0_seq1:609-965(+)